mmetsp:Transcript_47819/g.119608  ORF Transcript_47819/g.119608 Transcript_47819/m.119608 type:complete len:267 (+) Transcript_47819:1008-1808(+)
MASTPAAPDTAAPTAAAAAAAAGGGPLACWTSCWCGMGIGMGMDAICCVWSWSCSVTPGGGEGVVGTGMGMGIGTGIGMGTVAGEGPIVGWSIDRGTRWGSPGLLPAGAAAAAAAAATGFCTSWSTNAPGKSVLAGGCGATALSPPADGIGMGIAANVPAPPTPAPSLGGGPHSPMPSAGPPTRKPPSCLSSRSGGGGGGGGPCGCIIDMMSRSGPPSDGCSSSGRLDLSREKGSGRPGRVPPSCGGGCSGDGSGSPGVCGWKGDC